MKFACEPWSLWKLSNPAVGKASATRFYWKSTEVLKTLHRLRIYFNHLISMVLKITFFWKTKRIIPVSVEQRNL
jgi:hypothetical protein